MSECIDAAQWNSFARLFFGTTLLFAILIRYSSSHRVLIASESVAELGLRRTITTPVRSSSANTLFEILSRLLPVLSTIAGMLSEFICEMKVGSSSIIRKWNPYIENVFASLGNVSVTDNEKSSLLIVINLLSLCHLANVDSKRSQDRTQEKSTVSVLKQPPQGFRKEILNC